MKPFKIVLFIVALSLMTVLVTSVSSGIRHSQNERKVTQMLGEIKALGIATTDKDDFHPIPDSENAWVDVKPLLTKSIVSGIERPAFNSQLPANFLKGATKKDLPTLKKYLLVNKTKREAVMAAIEAKPKIQIHFDHDMGYDMKPGDTMIIRDLQRELCLAALAAALEGDVAKMCRNLKVARRLVTYDFESGEPWGVKSGISGRHDLFIAMIRILELRPDLYDSLQNFYVSQPPIAKTDCRAYVEAAFLSELATLRYYDLPTMDRSRPIINIGNFGEIAEPMAGGSPKHDDHMPQSPAVRNYMVHRMEKWLPLLRHMRSNSSAAVLPTITDLDAMQEDWGGDFRHYIDSLKNYSQFANGWDGVSVILNRNAELEAAEQVLFRAFEFKKKSGKFPSSLSQMGVNTDAFKFLGGLNYSLESNGFTLKSTKTNSSGNSVFNYAYPYHLAIKQDTLDNFQKYVKDFAAGKLDSAGFEPSSGASSAPGGPVYSK